MTSQTPHCHRPLRTVLIGTSLEEESDQVVRAGLAVARAAGGQVHLVHAAPVEPPLSPFQVGLVPDFIQQQIAWREERLREQVQRTGIAQAELAGTTVLTGAAHRILIDTAQTAGADLIVVGATGSGPLAAELLGSTADRVLRKAGCPVLVVRGELRVPPRRVLAPVDLSPLGSDSFRCGLDLLAQIAKGGETTVRVLHALSFLDALALERQRTQGTGEVSYEQAKQVDAEQLQRFVLENGPESPFSLETAVVPGEARFEILHDLEAEPADLVMLGTHGRGGFDRLVLGSVAATVARKAPCSVLLISPEAALVEGLVEAVEAQTAPAWHRES